MGETYFIERENLEEEISKLTPRLRRIIRKNSFDFIGPYQRMNREIRNYWCWHLRYGTYRKGKDGLRKKGRHCCLGVLCDLGREDHWEIEGGGVFDSYLGASGYLPAWIGESAGISGEMASRAACLNDCGASFEEIADWLEVFS